MGIETTPREKSKENKVEMNQRDFQRLGKVPFYKAFVMLGYQAKFNCKVIGFLADNQIVLRTDSGKEDSLKFIPFETMKKELMS